MHRSGHVIAIFGNHVTIATSVEWRLTIGVFVSNYQQNWNDFEAGMASKVRVPPLKGQVSENLSMLKVNLRSKRDVLFPPYDLQSRKSCCCLDYPGKNLWF